MRLAPGSLRSFQIGFALVLSMGSAASQVPSSPVPASGTSQLPPSVPCAPAWQPTFVGPSVLGGRVQSTCVYDDGSGMALYAGGAFTATGSGPALAIARWNGASWSALGAGLHNSSGFTAEVDALAAFDDGSGPALYAGGSFDRAGAVPVLNVAKWNGTSWSAVGSGVAGQVWALQTFDDGSGPALYAAGWFAQAGGVAANSIAKWNGSSWSALGSGLLASGSTCWVNALAVFDGVTGPELYAGGEFTTAGGISTGLVAKWNGASWSAVGVNGLNPGPNRAVYALAAFGGRLYIGGDFRAAGGFGYDLIVSWTGTTWLYPPNGISGGTAPIVQALHVHDDGSGPALYAAGTFQNAGLVPANGIARWNGTGWSALGSGITYASTVASYDAGGGPSLMVGGNFSTSPAGDAYLARWASPAGCGSPGVSLCEPGTAGVSACPCGNAPAGPGLGCDNSSNTGGAQLSASGIARLTYDTVVLSTLGEKPTATSIVLQGTSVSSGGLVFGQGVRCTAGTIKRLYVKTASSGSISAPGAGEASVHARSAALGDTIPAGAHRYYGVYYRDPIVLGGCAATSTFNITQQLDLFWSP